MQLPSRPTEVRENSGLRGFHREGHFPVKEGNCSRGGGGTKQEQQGGKRQTARRKASRTAMAFDLVEDLGAGLLGCLVHKKVGNEGRR